jgi:hypothetical protein
MNNMIIIDNQGLFIYINVGYPRSYHDVTYCGIPIFMPIGITILPTWMSTFEHLLGYPSYMGEKMFYHVINWSA